jgi:negative regulator of sigma E activity
MDEETQSENTVSELKSALYGTKPDIHKAKNEVRYVPKNFIDWFLENRNRFNETDSMPDFVTANIEIIISSYEYYKNQNQGV